MESEWTFQNPGTFVGDFLPKLIRHQQQGTLDGACGFYCIAMILDYWDIGSPHDTMDGRTRLARYLSALGPPLITRGLSAKELRNITHFFPSDRLTITRSRITDYESARSEVRRLTSQAIPGILSYSIHYETGTAYHYSVTVGTGEKSIYLMDPFEVAPEGTLFNNYLRKSRQRISDKWNRKIKMLSPLLGIAREGFTASDVLWRPRG